MQTWDVQETRLTLLSVPSIVHQGDAGREGERAKPRPLIAAVGSESEESGQTRGIGVAGTGDDVRLRRAHVGSSSCWEQPEVQVGLGTLIR